MIGSHKATKQEGCSPPIRVLLIDDEADTLFPSLAQAMEPRGFVIFKESEADRAAASIKKICPDIILLDLHFPGDDCHANSRTTGGILLSTIRREFPAQPVVLFTTRIDDNEIPLEKFDELPHGYFAKSDLHKDNSGPENLALMLRRAIKAAIFTTNPEAAELSFLVGKTKKMLKVADMVRIAASNTLNVLIYGESGTGKQLVAESIHKLSDRAAGRFEEVNCSGVDENTLQSQIFGTDRGGYTGANERKMGFLELADKGTLFLDEIQGMPRSLQDKLMKVIEDGTFRRMGGQVDLHSDFRLIVATNKPVAELIHGEQACLREDLAYRFADLLIDIPPLRDRLDDLPELIELFLKKANQRTPGKGITSYRKEVFEMLSSYHWRGNSRDLEKTILRAVAITTSSILMPEDIRFVDFVPPNESSPSLHSQRFDATAPNQSEDTGCSVVASLTSGGEEEARSSDVDKMIISLTDTLEALPLSDRYQFLLGQKDKTIRKHILTEFIRRLHLKSGEKVRHKALAQAIDPLTNEKDDFVRIRKLVCETLTLSELDWNQ